MLIFLNSAILMGLAAVAIPILIHLFTRKKTKVIDFSSLRFLLELQKRQIRRLKIRQILLLILRALLVLFLVLTFARPALRQTRGSSLRSGAQLTAAIVLDNTLSMGYKHNGERLLERAKRQALEVVNLLRQGDEIYLIYPQDPPVIPHEGAKHNLDSVRELIENTELAYGNTDYIGALSLAHNLMENSPNINKEVYVLGDLQANGIHFASIGNGLGTKLIARDVSLFVMPTSSDAAENLSIDRIRFGNQILEKNKVIEIETTLRNNSQKAAKNKLVHLFVNGKRVGQNTVDLEPNSATKVIFRMVPDRTGLQSGYVLLEDDDLLEDNRRYFSFHIPDEIPVLLVGNRRDDTRFIQLALSPERNASSNFTLESITRKELGEKDLGRFQCVILSNVSRFDHVEALKIEEYVAAGGGLMVFLGADVNIRNYNENLHKKLNLPPLTESITSRGQDQFLSLGKFDFSHPIFRDVFEGDKNVISPHFRFAINLKPGKPIDKIIEFSNGAPFLFESPHRKGRILYATSGISSDWSDFAMRGIFVLLINRSVVYLAGATTEEKDDFYVNDEIAFQPDGSFSNPDLTMEGPDGEIVKIKPEVFRGKYSVRYSGTQHPGIYKLFNQGERLTQWAVNYDPVETENAAIDPHQLKDVIETEQFYVIENTGDIEERLVQSRFGTELWRYFAAAALILILIEMALVREKRTVAN